MASIASWETHGRLLGGRGQSSPSPVESPSSAMDYSSLHWLFCQQRVEQPCIKYLSLTWGFRMPVPPFRITPSLTLSRSSLLPASPHLPPIPKTTLPACGWTFCGQQCGSHSMALRLWAMGTRPSGSSIYNMFVTLELVLTAYFRIGP